MGRRPLFRLIRRPGFLGALLFLGALALAAVLANQAARSAAIHRYAAEATLSHHATIAAWRFAREGRSWIGWGMGQAGDQLLHEVASLPALPGPELLQKVLAQKDCDCMSAGFSRTVFLVRNVPNPELVLRGDSLSDSSRRALLAAAVAALADTAPRQGPRQWNILPPGEPALAHPTDVVLLWKVGDRTRGVRGVYGMIVEAAQIERPLKGALGESQFFPASLIPPRTADSLVRIEVAGPNRQNLFSSGPGTHRFTGTDTLGLAFGSLKVTAAIDPAAARHLIVGGLPASRPGAIWALLGLTLALGAGALLLLRREHRLARLREDFVSGVSHELRTPLTQIRVLSELLQSDGFKSDAERSRATGVIHREAMRLSNLVDNVLEFARLRRPIQAGPVTRVALGEVTRELADSFAPWLEAQDVKLELEVAEELEVRGERDAVTRVLRNLVENAVKYGPPGQTIRVSVGRNGAAGGGGGTARVIVDDEGPGIPEAERARIWHPYYRLERDRNAPAGGSGLGLSVVTELLGLLGGRAWIENGPGAKGARFIVELPLAAP